MLRIMSIFTLVLALYTLLAQASPLSPSRSFADRSLALNRRTDPYFPDTPASCPVCEKASPIPSQWSPIFSLWLFRKSSIQS